MLYIQAFMISLLIIVHLIHSRSYETSKLYRDLKLRGSIVRDGELTLLPSEEVYSKVYFTY